MNKLLRVMEILYILIGVVVTKRYIYGLKISLNCPVEMYNLLNML